MRIILNIATSVSTPHRRKHSHVVPTIAQPQSKRQHGDIAGAMNSSKNARLWCWLSLILGLIVNLLLIAGVVLKVVAEMQHTRF